MRSIVRASSVVLVLVSGCGSPGGADPTTSSAQEDLQAVAMKVTPTYVDWTNQSGTYRVYTACLGPDPGLPGYIGHDGTVGPGYVATAWTRDGRVVTDDTIVPAHIGPNSGATGLGQFGFHLARVPQNGKAFVAAPGDVFQVATRFCNANRRPSGYGGYAGFGVRRFATTTAPSVDGSGLGHLAIETVLGDAYSDLVSVRYSYVVGARYVKTWIRVTTLCGDGKCDSQAASGDAYVKEPKIIVGANPASPDDVGYRRMTTFAQGGFVASSATHDNRWSDSCGASSGFPASDDRCEWGFDNPRTKTGQCDDSARDRVRVWDGVSCPGDAACLVVGAGAAATELAPSTPWSSDVVGLDAWAARNVAQGRDRASPADSPAGGAQWSCHGDSAAVANRRWEMAGYDETPSCNWRTAVASMHAWEGGSGMFDCENLYYRFGPAGETYVAALSYGFESVAMP